MEKDQYFLTNREYVHKAIEHFTSIFKYYVIEMLKRVYGDQYLTAIANGPGNDSKMNNSESKLKTHLHFTLLSICFDQSCIVLKLIIYTINYSLLYIWYLQKFEYYVSYHQLCLLKIII